MSFTQYLRIPELAARYKKIQQYFYLKLSTYDVTSICQLRCDGCFYFQGDKDKFQDVRDPDAWTTFFQSERDRGINFVVLAGAEPSLVPKVLRACYAVQPLGTIVTNGLKRIDPEVGYNIHVSVWGDQTSDAAYRKQLGGQPSPFCLPIQLKNYQGDDRLTFVYTFTNENVDQLDEILKMVSDAGHKLTFNMFSSPAAYDSPLKFKDALIRTRQKMFDAIECYPDTIVYSYYNAEAHTQEKSLDQLFGCPYPRAASAEGRQGLGLSQTYRNYRTDFSHDLERDCCVPDTDCADCRHYAASSSIVPARLNLHVGSERLFRGWLDFVDTYLALWVRGYQKGDNLYVPDGDRAELALV